MTHAEALDRLRVIRQEDDKPSVNPVCAWRGLDHGRRTKRAVVLLHGFTNCPRMYDQLAAELHRQGASIVVPRLPRHGLADRLTTELTELSADEMTETAAEAVAIARGLGDHVTVAGLSLGGVLAGWVAQFGDADRAVLVAPIFCAPKVPEWFSDLAGFAADHLPNHWLWWDPRAKEDIEGPAHAYPRFPTHAYGEMLRLGYQVKRAARRQSPRCGDIRAVLNDADPAVNNDATRRLLERWRGQGATVSVYAFARERAFAHDLISPDQTYQRTAEVYPVLIDQITGDVGLAA